MGLFKVTTCFVFVLALTIVSLAAPNPNSNDAENYREEHFKTPKTVKFDHTYDYRIKFSKSVCQIRLEFQTFDISLPHHEKAIDTVTCAHDYFFVGAGAVNKIPHLCGYNKNQHLYIHLDKSYSEGLLFKDYIDIHMHLASRDGTHDDDGRPLTRPEWDIKIIKISCPSYSNHNENPSEADIVPKDEILKKDPLYVPYVNCLQYFHQSSGSEVKSFNYYLMSSKYLTGLDYLMCFPQTGCNTISFDLSINMEVDNLGVTNLCESSYIEIMNPITKDMKRYCGKGNEHIVSRNEMITIPTVRFYSFENINGLSGFQLNYMCDL